MRRMPHIAGGTTDEAAPEVQKHGKLTASERGTCEVRSRRPRHEF